MTDTYELFKELSVKTRELMTMYDLALVEFSDARMNPHEQIQRFDRKLTSARENLYNHLIQLEGKKEMSREKALGEIELLSGKIAEIAAQNNIPIVIGVGVGSGVSRITTEGDTDKLLLLTGVIAYTIGETDALSRLEGTE